MSNEKKHNIMEDLSSMASSTMTTITNMKQDISNIVAEQLKAFMQKMDFVTKAEFDALKKVVKELAEERARPASRSFGDRKSAPRRPSSSGPRRPSEGRGGREERDYGANRRMSESRRDGEGRGNREDIDYSSSRRTSDSRRDAEGRREREDYEGRGDRRPAGRSFGRKSESSEGRRFGGRSSDDKRTSKSFGPKRSESSSRERDDRSTDRRPKLAVKTKKAASE
ncbi:MAG: accessory factor UbiK family protein [Alphaproteobacteria bacterium]|jgi:BMFP domain-containing protein YqiC|nr:accessory factor UbiK family protein [Candidatus Jidaibacter sp.]